MFLPTILGLAGAMLLAKIFLISGCYLSSGDTFLATARWLSTLTSATRISRDKDSLERQTGMGIALPQKPGEAAKNIGQRSGTGERGGSQILSG